MKKFIGVISVCAFMATAFLFQNCGKKEDSASGQIDSLSVSEYDSTLKVFSTDTLELVAPDTIIAEFLVSGECGWVFQSFDGKSANMPDKGTKLTLNNVTSKDAGKYTLTCQNENATRKVRFVVNVDTRKPDTDPDVGVYSMSLIVKGVKSSLVIIKEITKASALTHCKENALKNPLKGVECLWKGVSIFSQLEKADLTIYALRDGKSVLLSTVKDLLEVKALVDCKAAAVLNVKDEVKCLWGTKQIYAESPIEILKVIELAVGKTPEKLFKTINNFSEKFALDACMVVVKTTPKKKFRCTFGSKEIYNANKIVN